MAVLRLSRAEARRIAVHAQLLDAPRPTDLLEVVDRLTVLQIDPTAAIAPSADLVLWSRLGSTYDPAELTRALEQDRTLVETVAYVRAPRDLPAVIAEVRETAGHPSIARWLEVNAPFRRDILTLLEERGPLLSREIPDTSVEPWPSSGWTNNRNVTKMVEAMALRGEVAIAGRKGRQRLFDVPSRVHGDLPVLDLETAVRHRNERRLASLGIARTSGTQVPGESPFVGDAGVEAVVEDTPGTWRVHRAYVGLPFAGRTALLSPFDRLVHDRVRAEQLFDFEYVLEMYKPTSRRRWGYFALPVLHGDRLVGKLDATADRRAGTLDVHALHEDVAFTAEVHADVHAEIADLARWLGLEVRPGLGQGGRI